MVNRDGFTVATKIRHNREYNELPIVLVKSLASDQDKRRGAEAGAIAYITKAGLLKTWKGSYKSVRSSAIGKGDTTNGKG